MAEELRLEYRLTGTLRKQLVKAVAEFKESFSEYCGAPSFAYIVEGITINKEGAVIFPEGTEAEEVEELTAYLAGKGFTLGDLVFSERTAETATGNEARNASGEAADEMTETPVPHKEDDLPEETTVDAAQTDMTTIEVPRAGFTPEALTNLQKLIDSKASLLKKSLGTDDLSIEITDDRIRFPWLTDTDSYYIAACTKLIAAICKMAKEAKRVTATDHEVESEKYAFRTWLLRLGFNGSEYKHDRAILMRNLSGTAAFKNAADAQDFADKQKAKRDTAKAARQENEEATDEHQ